jgi:GNAT superfamily N-acetyltransferase
MAVWPPDAFIHHLYIDTAYRGKGIGKAMLALTAQTYPSPLSLNVLLKTSRRFNFIVL